MSGGGMLPSHSASASEIFSSTPVKSSQGRRVHVPRGAGGDDGVLSDDEDTFSQLSPIYQDSSDSDEELTSQGDSESMGSSSPVRCELPRTPSERLLSSAAETRVSLGPWETWLVNKARADRLNMERKTDEERLLKEKQEQEEMELERKKIIVEEKIQEWLKMKREREKEDQLRKMSEEEEKQRQQEKQLHVEQRAQQKYKDWLQKKDQEKTEKQRKEKEQAYLKEEQERERRRRAEQKFKEWLAKANEKTRTSPKSPWGSTNPYDKSHPSPTYCNPIPWKPIHVPPPEPSVRRAPDSKPQRPRNSPHSSGSASQVRNSASAPPWLQRR